MICTPVLHAAEACDCGPMLRAALDYAARGWHVFPLGADKIPVAGSHGYLDATTDPVQIRRWWTERPDAPLAIACRASGFIAIDVDPRNGGLETFIELERTLGPLPRDMVQESRSGGFHILLADPSPGPDGWTRPHAKIRGDFPGGVDVKCNGYIVAHPTTGYTWTSTSAWEPPQAPDAWVTALRKPEASSAAPEGARASWEHDSDPAPLPFGDSVKLTTELAKLKRKQGNDATMIAYRMIFHDYGLSVASGWPYLLAWNAGCGAPHSDAELRRQLKIADKLSVEQNGLRGRSRSDLDPGERVARAPFDPPGNSPAAPGVTPTTPPAGAGEAEDLVIATASGVTSLAELADMDEATSPGSHVGEQPALSRFRALLLEALVDVQRLLATNDNGERFNEPLFEAIGLLFGRSWPDTQWQVRELVTLAGLLMLATEPKSAKTWAMTEIAVAIATGTPAFGVFPTERGRVAYFYAEDMGKQIRNRVRALLAARGKTVADVDGWLFVQPRGKFLDLTKDADLAWLVASCRVIGDVKFVALDPMRDIHSGKESDNDEMAVVLRRLRALSELLNGATAGVVHHAAKDNREMQARRPGQKMRGASAIHGSVDSGLYLQDLETDGRRVFKNSVTSEVKGARSAGVFDLTLEIDDDELGEAVCAKWTVDRAGAQERAASKEAAQEAEARAAVFRAIQEADGELAWSHIDHGMNRDRAKKARAQLMKAGSIKKVTHGIDGKKLSGDYYVAIKPPDLSAPDEPAPPPSSAGPHPIGAFVKDPE